MKIREPIQGVLQFEKQRILVWFSCGAASAVAAKMAVEQDLSTEVLYCRVANEHPDNMRFLHDVENWIGKEVKILENPEYPDANIFSVFRKTRWLNGVAGARCSIELKRKPRKNYQRPDDIHVFGMTAEEHRRISRFELNNPELYLWWLLRDNGITKQDCFDIVRDAGIELPVMYQLGYKNANCIGCVKGGKGYWNKIRQDFPLVFEEMAKFEREIDAHVLKDTWLDKLPVNVGRYESEYDIECGVLCEPGE